LRRDGRLWFCTNHTKEVYKDLQQNPYVQISVASPSYAWIRLDGKAVFENNHAVKEGCMSQSHRQKASIRQLKIPIFEVFYLEDAHAVIADFSGNPPRAV
jgi:uncharacterized pyridoxamine 5'-phosphate oxidase family protein